ncbi:MAG: hypothetical protein K2K69_03360 [Muribaculaceae bacterium]|nr:hypothetical protein [Muribaculaceae bacterium]
MKTKIENILSDLVIKTAEHFQLAPQDALAAVAQSGLADELSRNGNVRNLSIEQLCQELYAEISRAE